MDGKAEEVKTSEAFFRKNPFGGSYLLCAGLGEFVQWLDNWHFTKEDIEYLRQEKNADGSKRFDARFLQFLDGQKLRLDIQAVPEGELVFPNEPVYSVTGPTWQVDFNAQVFIYSLIVFVLSIASCSIFALMKGRLLSKS